MPNGNMLSSIEHVVVLMLENRSFDHMLGFLYADTGNKSPSGQPFEGLTGTESNPDSNGKPVKVFKITKATKNAYFMPGSDPGEGYSATNSQLFGSTDAPTPPVATNQGFVTDFAYTLGWQKNNPSWAKDILPGTVANNIMGCYTPEMLPVLSGLARGYAVCDHWYSSAPTETFPNRAFANAATSQGHMDDNTKVYTVKCIFDLMTAQNVSWMIYGYDSAAAHAARNFPGTIDPPTSLELRNLHGLSEGRRPPRGLWPSYSVPRARVESSSRQQPAPELRRGARRAVDTRRVLRGAERQGLEPDALLIITYDEHGGCYDHVPPPLGRDASGRLSAGEYGFDFKRFGVRVPAVLISPLIAPGTVFRVPDGSDAASTTRRL
jgi:phospholipase C